ncbi:TetR/AcrR family transcriptional regulator [Luteimonas suaedae]|uniref:TetR/AcrR family transcriptional regulator n=1 Tax=Luteimonas suaedae TaxID=2605430 RepID=UPI0011EC1E49|nr:TetR/AcrR family transcriptional regulator [Luteimonas suaedae]
MTATQATKSRRRGPALEKAILESAWAELAEKGYAALTMEAVAARAGTSRTVLARRWESRAALAMATLRHQMSKHPLNVQECGDLRTELLEFLDRAGARLGVISVVFSLLHVESAPAGAGTPQELRAALREGEGGVLSAILDRAVQRGEIDPSTMTPVVSELLGDLYRHYAIMNRSAPSEKLRQAWVDTIFLPLVRADQPKSG